MWPFIGLVLLGVAPSGLAVDEKPQPEFKIEVRIVEFEAIEGVTKQDPDSKYHLHIKPALVVTPADVASVQKRRMRGPTIGSRETGFKHYPSLVVNIQLTREAKLRLKAAVLKARPATTTPTGNPLITTVFNGKHDGSWTKYVLDDPTSLVYWSNFGPSIGCTRDKEKADKLIKYLTRSKENE